MKLLKALGFILLTALTLAFYMGLGYIAVILSMTGRS